MPSNPGWPTGYVPTAAEWAAEWSSKVDYPAPVSQGGTGTTQIAPNGGVLLGNNGGYTAALIGSGPGLKWTAGAGSLSIGFDGATGTGNIVLQNSPLLITPNIGVATATSVAMTSGTVTAAPSGATSITNKAYVDGVAQGLSIKQSCQQATTTALPACTYTNGVAGVGALLTANAVGVLTIDGNVAVLGNRVLVKNQAAQLQNGIYVVSTAGTASVAWVLTRALDSDQPTDIQGGFTFIENGTVNAATGWVNNNATAPTIGTTAITYVQFSGAGTYLAGTGLTLTGTTFSITSTGVTAGSYAPMSATVNAQGQLTAAASLPTTGSGSVVLAASPVLVTPALGTPSAAVLTNATGLPIAGIAGLGTGVGGALAANVTGTGGIVLATNAVLVTPNLGTPSAAVLTSATGLPLTTGVTGLLPATNGGTGLGTYAIGDLLYASATNALSRLAAVATGSALISQGASAAPIWGKIDLTAGVSGILPVANGGTGKGGATPWVANGVVFASSTAVITNTANLTWDGATLTANGGTVVGTNINGTNSVTAGTALFNQLQAFGSSTGNNVTLTSIGGDAAIGISFSAKGAGSFAFATGGGTQFAVYSTASAVNRLQITGGATGVGPQINALSGVDANVDIRIIPQGTGVVTTPAGATIGGIVTAGSALANKITLTGGATTVPVVIGATGTDANVTMQFNTKGLAPWLFYSNADTTPRPQFSIVPTAAAINYITVTGGDGSSTNPILSTAGTSANPNLQITPKGTGTVLISSAVTVGFGVANQLTLTGAAATATPVLSVTGSDTNINIGYIAKGAGSHVFYTGGNQQFGVVNVASAVNYIQVQGAATAGAPGIVVVGTDTNIGFSYVTKGTGVHTFYANNGGFAPQLVVGATASAVNYLSIAGAASTGAPTITANGTDTNISLWLAPKGTGTIVSTGPFQSFSTIGASTSISAGTGNTNQITINGAGTSAYPTIGVGGSDTDTGIQINTKGAGYVNISNRMNIGSAFANGILITGVATAGTPNFTANGSDTNIGLGFYSKGAGTFDFYGELGAGQPEFRVTPVLSSVNYVGITSATTGVSPSINASGTDTSVGLIYTTKTTGTHDFYAGGVRQFQVGSAASAVNYVQMLGGATTVTTTISALGSDTNVNLTLTTKGAGTIIANKPLQANSDVYGVAGSLAQTAGFFYISAAAGAPTGVPTGHTGTVAMYYDSTNNNFYVYNGAWKKVTLT